MASTDEKQYRLQKNVHIIDASNPTQTKISCINEMGDRVSVTLNWYEDIYPNKDCLRAPRDPKDRGHGMLKPMETSPPVKEGYGDLLVAMAKVSGFSLPVGKYPSELPGTPNYKKLKFRPLSLKLKVLLENGIPSKDVELLLPENADLLTGLRLVDDRVEAMLNDEAFEEDLG